MLNRLRNLGCYLSGSIDFDPNKGKSWRLEISPFLEQKNIKVFNPLQHHKNFHIPEDIDIVKRPYMDKLLEEGKYTELREEMKDIVHLDLRAIDLSSFCIINYNTDLHLCGSVEEISIFSKQIKPILFMCKNGIKKLPSWLFGRHQTEYFFESWDDLKNYLTDIDSNPNYKFTRTDLKRWIFMSDAVMEENKEEIKPCPFCGGRCICNNPLSSDVVKGWYIACTNCYAFTAKWDSKEDAIEHWNTRK